jgi:leader peptidase (prepilin peptidase) / N-methyltransferase
VPRKRRFRINWPLAQALLATLLLFALLVCWRTSIRLNFRHDSIFQWQIALVTACMEAAIFAWFLATGASIGSFLNVAAWRVPRSMSLLVPSKCPYCCTALSFYENMPIFGWIRLRARCRTCHLPIAARYVLVELFLLVVFGWICLNEFLTAGSNLPTQPFKYSMTLDQRLLKSPFGLQLFLYLWVVCGLIAVTLMSLQKSKIPWRVYLWTAVPCFILPLFEPSIIQVHWKAAVLETIAEKRMAAALTALLGMIVGAIAGLVVSLITARLFKPENTETVDSDFERNQFLAGIMTVAASGALMGWQAVLVIAPLTMLIMQVARSVLQRFALTQSFSVDATRLACWTWLAVVVYRSTWVHWVALAA